MHVPAAAPPIGNELSACCKVSQGVLALLPLLKSLPVVAT